MNGLKCKYDVCSLGTDMWEVNWKNRIAGHPATRRVYWGKRKDCSPELLQAISARTEWDPDEEEELLEAGGS